MSQTLVCNHCHQTNKLFRFSFNKKYNKYYSHNQCRDCDIKAATDWIKNNKERFLINARAVGKARYQTEHRKLWLAARDHRRKTAPWEEELTNFVAEEAYRLKKLRKQMTYIDWHLDHIIPLKGKNVSGLHVWNNLQVIPKEENLKKGNRYAIST